MNKRNPKPDTLSYRLLLVDPIRNLFLSVFFYIIIFYLFTSFERAGSNIMVVKTVLGPVNRNRLLLMTNILSVPEDFIASWAGMLGFICMHAFHMFL